MFDFPKPVKSDKNLFRASFITSLYRDKPDEMNHVVEREKN